MNQIQNSDTEKNCKKKVYYNINKTTKHITNINFNNLFKLLYNFFFSYIVANAFF